MAVYLACLAVLISLLSPIQRLAEDIFPGSRTFLVVFIVVIFSILLMLVYFLSGKLIGVLFVSEEYQNRLISSFSEEASKSLNTDEITKSLVSAIAAGGISIGNVYICLLEGDSFIPKASSNSLNPLSFLSQKTIPALPPYKIRKIISLWRSFNIPPCIVPCGDGKAVV